MNAMLATSRRTRSVLRVGAAARLTGGRALAVLVAALVVGILGMHALASHGTPAAPADVSRTVTGWIATGTAGTSSSAHEAAMASGGSHDGHAHAAAPALQGAAAVDTTGTDTSGSAHGMSSMVMLCVVMLSAAALALLVLLVTGFLRPLRPAAFQPAAVRTQALKLVRGTGPPEEWQFSVIRC